MADYRVLVRCPECAQTHAAKVLNLERGPARETSLADLGEAAGGEYGLVSIPTTYMFCDRTKRFFLQQDAAQVFISPVAA